MKLENRIRQSIKRRSGTVVLRAEVADLGSQSQVTHALDVLQRGGELVRLGMGIYAKTQRVRPEGEVRPLGSFATIIEEIIRKLGLPIHGEELSKATASVGKTPLVVQIDKPRISRKLVVDGKLVEFRSYRRKPRSPKAQSLTIPKKGVARFVQELARRYKVVYTSNTMDQWAEAVTRLAGDDVHADSTEDLLVALKRAGKISSHEVAALAISHLRERKKSVRSI